MNPRDLPAGEREQMRGFGKGKSTKVLAIWGKAEEGSKQHDEGPVSVGMWGVGYEEGENRTR
jgi:hypothetical protein